MAEATRQFHEKIPDSFRLGDCHVAIGDSIRPIQTEEVQLLEQRNLMREQPPRIAVARASFFTFEFDDGGKLPGRHQPIVELADQFFTNCR